MASTLGMRLSVKAAIALLLTFSAGYVDVVGYITLYQTFTSHMTGVTVHLGENIVAAHWGAVWMLSAVLLSFVLGALAGRMGIEITRRSGIRRSATPLLALEALLIGAVAVADSRGRAGIVLVYLLAAAMGLQTAVLTRVGSLTVHTTFVTGILNRLAELVANLGFLTWDVRRGNGDSGELVRVSREALFIFAVWCFYIGGVVTGTALAMRWSYRALLTPLCLVVVAVVTDCLHPLRVAEEHQFPES